MYTNTLLLALGCVAFGVMFQRLIVLRARLDRLSRLEGKIDAMLRASGVSYDPLATAPSGVREALEEGKYILAIKRLREATGVGLKEAKDTIDELRRRRSRALRDEAVAQHAAAPDGQLFRGVRRGVSRRATLRVV